MKVFVRENCGSTRVARVQFGVPPNCDRKETSLSGGLARREAGSPPVSGATPETTRQRRVPPAAIGNVPHA